MTRREAIIDKLIFGTMDVGGKFGPALFLAQWGLIGVLISLFLVNVLPLKDNPAPEGNRVPAWVIYGASGD